MAVEVSFVTRSVFSNRCLLFTMGVISKSQKKNLVTLSTLKQMKPVNMENKSFCNNFENKSCLKSYSFNDQLIKINSFSPLLTKSLVRHNSSQPDKSSSPETQLSNKEKLKRAVKEYGATVIIFHVTISLVSLGVTYLAVTSGIDIQGLCNKIGLWNNGAETSSTGSSMLGSTGDVAVGVSSFVIAYAVHKAFAPVRISITLLCTPFIVRHLRKIGVLKSPKPTSSK